MLQRFTDNGSLTREQDLTVVGRKAFWGLVASAVLTVVLWQIPGGNYILYPFTILATWFHEMAHGLTALALGGHFSRLLIFSNGSGAAYYSGPLLLGTFGKVLVAAAGPMGPPIAGAALIFASRNLTTASIALKFLGGFLLISTAVWVRSFFGFFVIPLMGLAVLGLAFKGSEQVQRLLTQFLGVQACVSTYRQIEYLFSYSAGPLGISDTGQIQQAFLLPYWLWGGLLALSSLLILVMSLRSVYRS
jgi:hypothetical protein